MGIEEDIAVSESLIRGIVSEHDLDNKSSEELIEILKRYSAIDPREVSPRDKVTASVLRVRLGDYDTGKYSTGDNGDGDVEAD
ncbi:MAG: hypothetical protein WCP89_03135 [archaeon]